MLATLGALLVALGILDLFIHIIPTVGAIPVIIIGVILWVVGGHSGWYRNGPPAP